MEEFIKRLEKKLDDRINLHYKDNHSMLVEMTIGEGKALLSMPKDDIDEPSEKPKPRKHVTNEAIREAIETIQDSLLERNDENAEAEDFYWWNGVLSIFGLRSDRYGNIKEDPV